MQLKNKAGVSAARTRNGRKDTCLLGKNEVFERFYLWSLSANDGEACEPLCSRLRRYAGAVHKFQGPYKPYIAIAVQVLTS